MILMRSASELQFVNFRSEKRIGRLLQSDIAKSDGIKSGFKVDCYANPIPSFRFGSGRKNESPSCKNEAGVLG